MKAITLHRRRRLGGVVDMSVVFSVEFRHCSFPVRRNQRDKWNEWCRYSVDFCLRREAKAVVAKSRRAIRRRGMQEYEEVRVQRRVLKRGECMAR